MNGLMTALITGVTAFVATNIDDILILTVFFSQVNATFRTRHIVLGQYLGFIGLIIVSLPGFLGGQVLPEAWIGLLGFLPIGIGLLQLFQDKGDFKVQTVSEQPQPSKQSAIFSSLFAPQTYRVAAVTFANGGDNIGIYVPLFANSNWQDLIAILCVFLVLVGVWCIIARSLTRHPAIAPILNQYGEAIVPYVLIGLGIFILIENRSYQLLPQFSP